METWLHRDLMMEWSDESLDQYQKSLQQQMAQLAIFYNQVLEERTRRWNARNGEMNG